MSGDVVLSDPTGVGWATRLARALRQVTAEVPAGSFALIGGFAVMARIARIHRVTEDLDAAAGVETGEERSRLALVVSAPTLAPSATGGGPKIDCIDVGEDPIAEWDPDALPDEAFARAFLLAHRWAFETATMGSITVVGAAHDAIEHVALRIASPAALVAMKLQAAPRRSPARRHKAISDYTDLFAILDDVCRRRDISADLVGAPLGLGLWCLERITYHFDADAERTARLIAQGAPVTPITAGDLRQVARAMVPPTPRSGVRPALPSLGP